ncbi:hypothetical protein B0H19DRAFT_1378262 [Mycena capillaripes]|nr:hypothetical protein B0H19DRAFT_1378262 [Mycena capillaripes]
MSIQLPQELVEEIVDHLKGDFASLKACSLVCRAWVFRTRPYLFEISETCRLEPDSIIDFYDLLRYPQMCTFLLHVRSVSAYRNYWHHNDRWFNEIATHLHHLANVRTLELTVNAPGSGAFLRAGFFAAFPQVTRLIITRADFGIRPAPLIDTICFFCALQELEIFDTSGRLSDPPAGAIPPPRG